MYSVNVRDHFMIAHSFQGAVFGPAQRMHGATYVVDWEIRREDLTADNIVVDIGAAGELLNRVLSSLNFQNLDEAPDFDGINTTTEFLARVIFDRLKRATFDGELGPTEPPFHSMRVVLHESHVAWAAYEGTLEDH
ncbi:MAG: 6-carboxytetrahydropterin synthase [Pseudomonadota bacterium]